MRFMYIVTSPQPMKGPTPELLAAVQKISEREIRAGRMIDNGGLMPLQTGARVKVADGKLSVTDGPFVEAKEVIGGYAIFELRDKEEALAMARRSYAGLGGNMRASRVRQSTLMREPGASRRRQ
jgi:hypothetical protein